jgi:hypothetical protein
VKAVAFMEAIVATAPNYDGLPKEFGQFVQGVKSEAGEKMILEQNMFIEGILPMSIMRKLEEEAMAEYRRPFLNPGEDRRPTLTWPRQIPVGGESEDVAKVIADYGQYLASTPTSRGDALCWLRAKRPYSNGTTHFLFEPLDLLAKLAALAPRHRVSLTRYHGVFAPNSTLRAQIVPGKPRKKTHHANYHLEPTEPDKQARNAPFLKKIPISTNIATHRQCAGPLTPVSTTARDSPNSRPALHHRVRAKIAPNSIRWP